MKNPIILKDLLVAINGLVGKCLSVLIIVTLFVLVILFGKEAHHEYLRNFPYIGEEFLIFGYIFLAAGIIFLATIKSIFSITSEKSGLTYELIFISKLSPLKYILGKFFSNVLFFIHISLLVLPFVGVFLFYGGIGLLDIIMLYFQFYFYILIGSALGVYLGILGRKIQISLVLLAIVGGLISFILLEYFNSLDVLYVIGAPFDMVLNSYSLLGIIALKTIIALLSCVYFLGLSVRFCKEETETKTERYPWYCSLIVFIFAAGNYYLYDLVGIEIFIFLSFIDAILFFLHTKTIARKDYLAAFGYVIINVILTVSTIILIDGFLFQTLLYYIMCMGVLLFISLFIQLYFRTLHRYLINVVYILFLGLFFIGIPGILYVQNSVTLPNSLKISDIFSAFDTKLTLDNYGEEKYNYHLERTRVNNTYHYNLFILIIFIIFFGLTHKIRKQSIDV